MVTEFLTEDVTELHTVPSLENKIIQGLELNEDIVSCVD